MAKMRDIINQNTDFFFNFNHNEIIGSPTGLSNIDSITDGIWGLNALTGTPGKGKTSLAIQITINNIFKTIL